MGPQLRGRVSQATVVSAAGRTERPPPVTSSGRQRLRPNTAPPCPGDRAVTPTSSHRIAVGKATALKTTRPGSSQILNNWVRRGGLGLEMERK